MHARTGKERLHLEQISLSKHTEGPVIKAPSPGKVRPRLLSRSLELTHLPREAPRPWREVVRSVTHCPRRLWKHTGSCPPSLSVPFEWPHR